MPPPAATRFLPNAANGHLYLVLEVLQTLAQIQTGIRDFKLSYRKE